MPHLSPLPDLYESLHTDPASGLSPKEAAKRREGSNAAPLFRNPPRRYAACVRQSIREPALWLMIAVAVISLFFERVSLGLFCLLLTLGNIALSAYFLYRADATDAAMLAYDTPLCRVLRGGRVIRIGADGLVAGDIILLYAGDIIPADCRLIRTDCFTVMERELDAADPLRPPVRLEKDADAYPEAGQNLRHSPVNMVFAGGMADSGSALALVVAVGSETHLGGLIGHVPSHHQGKTVSYFKTKKSFLSVYNLCLLCLIIPLTAMGIFMVGDTYEFLDIFLSALALATLTLTEHLMARGTHLAAAARRFAALDRDGANTAEIKSEATLEKLTSMTDLLLVGSAALHDGQRHPELLYLGGRIYHCDHPGADEEAKAIAELLYLYGAGEASLPAVGSEGEGFGGLIRDFCEWADVDTEALRIKIKEIRPRGQGVAGLFPTAFGNQRVTVRVTHRFDEAEACPKIHDGVRLAPLDTEGKNDLYRIYREEICRGRVPLFILVEAEGETSVRGMLSHAPHACMRTAGAIKNLERAGIRVTALLREEGALYPPILEACGLTENAPPDLPASEGMPRTPAVERISEGCRAFTGCSSDYIAECVAGLKAQGRIVGLLSESEADVFLLAEADIAFTCAPSLYAAAEAEKYVLSEAPVCKDGTPDGQVANDRSRRTAHVVVRRCSRVGGGVLGVQRALQAADGFRDGLDRTQRFLLISQIVRLIMTVLPLCLGLTIAPAPGLLISGLLVDLLVLTAALGGSLDPVLAPRPEGQAPLVRSPRRYGGDIVAAVIGAVLPWVIAGVAVLLDVEFGGDLIHFGLLSTLGLQLAIFRTEHLPRRDSTVLLTTFGLVLVYVGALAVALVGELAPFWALVWPLAAPLGYLLVFILCRGVEKLVRLLTVQPSSAP